MAAHVSNDLKMIEAYNSGIDIHQKTADDINKILKSNFSRQNAKSVNFGVLYGLYHNRLSEQTGLSLKDSKALINAWWKLYSGVKQFVEKTHAQARRTGYVETILGRRRNIHALGINDFENFRRKNYAENASISFVVSGSSADLIKVAMINIFYKYKDVLRLKLQVHDELLFEVPEEEAEKYAEIIKFEMENALKLRVTVEANVKIGNNWREVH